MILFAIKSSEYQTEALTHTDRRIHLMNGKCSKKKSLFFKYVLEIIVGIQLVKFYAWEVQFIYFILFLLTFFLKKNSFAKLVSKEREKEENKIYKSFLLNGTSFLFAVELFFFILFFYFILFCKS